MHKHKGKYMDEGCSHTHNSLKGDCENECAYCFANAVIRGIPGACKKALFIDPTELNKKMGRDNVIFYGSGNDILHTAVSDPWLRDMMQHCSNYPDNTYMFCHKGCGFGRLFRDGMPTPKDLILVTTAESNRYDKTIYLGKVPPPSPLARIRSLVKLKIPAGYKVKKWLFIDPFLPSDVEKFAKVVVAAKFDKVMFALCTGNSAKHMPSPKPEDVIKMLNLLRPTGKLYLLKVFRESFLARKNKIGWYKMDPELTKWVEQQDLWWKANGECYR
jgi:hypothetical protein